MRNDTLAGGGLTSDDIYSLTGSDIGNETLSGADIDNQSGVDTCTHGTKRFGELCVGVANVAQNWTAALNLCADLELRLPSLGEALSLASELRPSECRTGSCSGPREPECFRRWLPRGLRRR